MPSEMSLLVLHLQCLNDFCIACTSSKIITCQGINEGSFADHQIKQSRCQTNGFAMVHKFSVMPGLLMLDLEANTTIRHYRKTCAHGLTFWSTSDDHRDKIGVGVSG